MTCLEHLIENTLCNFEKNKSIEEIKEGIKSDCNLEYAGITKEQCWEICQYVWCTFILDNYDKIEDRKELIKELEKVLQEQRNHIDKQDIIDPYDVGKRCGFENALWMVKNKFYRGHY